MYPNQKITTKLIAELKDALEIVGKYGSIEIYIQEGNVTQITVRKIKKTIKNKS